MTELAVVELNEHIGELLYDNSLAPWSINELIWEEEQGEYIPIEMDAVAGMEPGKVYWFTDREHDSYAWVDEHNDPVVLLNHNHLMSEKELDVLIHTMLTQGSDMRTIMEFMSL